MARCIKARASRTPSQRPPRNGWAGASTQRTSRETGIPAGLPYLTGFVINEGIAAEAQD